MAGHAVQAHSRQRLYLFCSEAQHSQALPAGHIKAQVCLLCYSMCKHPCCISLSWCFPACCRHPNAGR